MHSSDFSLQEREYDRERERERERDSGLYKGGGEGVGETGETPQDLAEMTNNNEKPGDGEISTASRRAPGRVSLSVSLSLSRRDALEKMLA